MNGVATCIVHKKNVALLKKRIKKEFYYNSILCIGTIHITTYKVDDFYVFFF